MHLILGSSSKTRAAVLTRNGIEFSVMNPDIDEKAFGTRLNDNPDPDEVALAVANAKANAIIQQLTNSNTVVDDSVLLTCDQVVYYKGQIREKPESIEECKLFLKSYVDAPAETHSGLVLVDLQSGKRVQGVQVARQYFKHIPDEAVEAIIKQGDIMYCADRREGEEDSLLGMPMDLFNKLLIELKN